MAAQQVEEEGPTGQGGDRPHRKLPSPEQGTRSGVAGHQEGGAPQGRGGQQQAVVRAESQAQQVGKVYRIGILQATDRSGLKH